MNAPAGHLVLDLQLVVASPRERIFTALTDAAEVARWWGPHGYTMAETDLDLRVGGGYRFTMQPPAGDRFHLAGEFLEIEPPRRLVYTFRYEEPDPDDRQTVVTLSLEEFGDTTHVSLSQGEFATEARLELHRSGWTDSFERLSELTESSGSNLLAPAGLSLIFRFAVACLLGVDDQMQRPVGVPAGRVVRVDPDASIDQKRSGVFRKLISRDWA